MAYKPVGPSGSGADRANALSNSCEAAPASTPTAAVEDPSAACLLKRWFLQGYPAISSFLVERAQFMPPSVIHDLAVGFDAFLRQHCHPDNDLAVASLVAELYVMPPAERSEQASRIMMQAPSDIRLELRRLKSEIGGEATTPVTRSVRGLITLLGAAMLMVDDMVERSLERTA